MSDHDDDDTKFQKELAIDAEEAAQAELQDLLDATSGEPLVRMTGLLKKLSVAPDGAFKVSEYSEYRDATWLLERPSFSLPQKVTFLSDIPGAPALKRALAYHVLPDYSPFGRVKSFKTSTARAREFLLLEEYVFQANRLSATPNHIQLISTQILNEALDNAKQNGANRHYHSLFYIIRLWIALSQQQLIPIELRLPVNPLKVDTTERRRDVIAHFTGTLQTWLPFSESEIEKLVPYALFWTDEALPILLRARSYILTHHLDTGYKCVIARDCPDSELEHQLSANAAGQKLLSFSRVERTVSGGVGKYFTYTWVDSYARALDKVRNAIFVLVALITGMRARELTSLTNDAIFSDGDGNYWINITRFKTSNDPDYQGEPDVIPLPAYVATKVLDYVKLKDVHEFRKQGYLFQSNKSRRVVTKPTTAQLRNITAELMDDTGVDRIHPHRFRKTIAEILINRSERNLELIRLLFGHHSYSMSLAYIARNPYLVRGVAQVLEESFTTEFLEIVTAVRSGSYSGAGAERIAATLEKRGGDFSGRQFKITVLRYIAHLLAAGEPLFIQRTALGVYCMMCEEITEHNRPPCIAGRENVVGLVPDPSQCQVDCRFAVVVESAKAAIKDNVTFYLALLDRANEAVLAPTAERSVLMKIAANERHLANLEERRGLERAPAAIQPRSTS
jgi:hypothetical protein